VGWAGCASQAPELGQVRDVDGGAPGVHLYTFNRVRPALDVISHLRLGGILNGSTPDTAVQREVRRDYLNATPGGDRGPSARMPGATRP